MKLTNGVSYQRSMVKMSDITDGASNTYLVGEKCINADHYVDGNAGNDDHPCLGADDWDLYGWTANPPRQDTPGVDGVETFGSAHSNSLNMAFCDGSVQQISYTIDATVHKYLGSRNDGKPIDAKKLGL